MNPTFAFYGIADRFPHSQPGYTHDHNMCLMQEGRVLQYLHLERHTRRKYDNHLPQTIENLLDSDVISIPAGADLVCVNSFVGDSFVSANGRIRAEGRITRPLQQLQPGFGYVQPSPWEGREHPTWLVPHEIAHIASTLPFFGPWCDNSLLVHFDGGASQGNFSAFLFRDGVLTPLACDWELAHLSKLFNDNALAFALMQARPGEHTSVPGKLMGYAAFGRQNPEVHAWLREHDWFRNCWADITPVIRELHSRFGYSSQELDLHHPLVQDMAAAMQTEFEEGLLARLSALQKAYCADYLYYAGGCALNIVANTRLVDSHLFKEVFIPPACNDSGLSLGAAAWVEWHKHGKVQVHSPFLQHAPDEGPEQPLSPATLEALAEVLEKDGVVGVYRGKGEAGPRALGNRSLIARADKPEVARRVSMTCKRREWFRPVAPLMTEATALRLTGRAAMPHLSQFMLLDFAIPESHRPAIAGAVHVNGHARIQVVTEAWHGQALLPLLRHLEQTRGMVALLNTSFNAAGEPIVHTPSEALDSAQQMGLGALLLDNELFHF